MRSVVPNMSRRALSVVRGGSPLFEDGGVVRFRFRVPLPGVGEGLDLGRGFGAVLFVEQDVVVTVAVERRVEVDQIDGFGSDVPSKHIEVVAVEELIFLSGGNRGRHSP